VRRLVLIFSLLMLTGCGAEQPKLVSVTGKVTFKNEPLTAGNLYFHPDVGNSYQKDKPSSQLQRDGSFTMKTFPFGEGIPPGKYKVTLDPGLANRVRKPNYADPIKTPWIVEVPEGGLQNQLLEVQ
jgi:hypothetical protein